MCAKQKLLEPKKKYQNQKRNIEPKKKSSHLFVCGKALLSGACWQLSVHWTLWLSEVDEVVESAEEAVGHLVRHEAPLLNVAEGHLWNGGLVQLVRVRLVRDMLRSQRKLGHLLLFFLVAWQLVFEDFRCWKMNSIIRTQACVKEQWILNREELIFTSIFFLLF